MKKTLISLTLAAAGFVALAAPASAHTPQVSHDCTTAGSTLTVHLVQYEKGSTVTVNGSKSTFGQAEYKSTFNLGPADKAHTWTVVIDNKGDGFNKADKFDSTFTDTVKPCVVPVPTTTVPLEDKDLTPQTPPKVEYVNPAWPICMVPGKHLYNAHDPECVTDTVVMAPPMVLDRQPAPTTLAFTGAESWQMALAGVLILGAGAAAIRTGRAINKAKA